jgi:integrase
MNLGGIKQPGDEVVDEVARFPTPDPLELFLRLCCDLQRLVPPIIRLDALAGVPLEQVSILLGHKSVKITEKHYAPWVKARQEQLAANVRKAWNVLDTGNKTARRKSPKRVKSD